ncbi:hypothetical protein [Curvibacter delicatus]|uniref:hypothetical protein n=1 Tax=Curvibacter delicatus TaxID=80879 RepID=UPI00083434B4|nr:hypothetical protein [Curvibacter delicatus]
MKALITLVLVAAMPMSLLAQNLPSRKTHFAHGKQASSAKTAVAAATPVAAPAAPLSPAELALAERVQVGHVPCELGASVTVEADPKAAGYFHVRLGKDLFHMAPVVTSTGAMRLEDQHAGAVWLQLANKSMLMSTKLGKRLADACMNPSQVAVAAAMEKNPPPSLLDPVTPPPTMRNALALQDAAE